MAVVVRGSARAATMRRTLAQAGVPVTAATAETPVRDEVAVRPMLALLEEAVALARDPGHVVDPVRVADLVLSPIGGSDAVGLRRLRRLLRQEELADGRRPVERRAAVRAGPRSAVGGAPRRDRATGGPDRGGACRRRRGGTRRAGWSMGARRHLRVGPLGDLAGRGCRRRVAEAGARRRAGGACGPTATSTPCWPCSTPPGRFVDRLPTAGPDTFVEHLLGQDVPGDTLLVGGQAGPQVSLVTPQTAAGREWRLVVVAGVQEGVWPDLRLRGSILGSEDLVGVRQPASAGLPRGAGGGALRRDPAVPRRRDPRHGAVARDGGRQRGGAAVGLPRPRRPPRGRANGRRGEAAHGRRSDDVPRRARGRAAARGRQPRSGRCRAGLGAARDGGARRGSRSRPGQLVGAARRHDRASGSSPGRSGPRLSVQGHVLLRVCAALVPHLRRR